MLQILQEYERNTAYDGLDMNIITEKESVSDEETDKETGSASFYLGPSPKKLRTVSKFCILCLKSEGTFVKHTSRGLCTLGECMIKLKDKAY